MPFHIPRFFRPTFIDVFELSNTALGDIFAVYGIVATLCYFPGGILADRFPPRKLMAFSLFATALGGFYLWTIPSSTDLYFLFGYWGCTSVLLFWAAMIKETRIIAGQHSQGVAFGLLDGGRGLVASVVASIGVFVLASFLTQSNETIAQKQQAMQAVILFYSLMTCLAALLVWFYLPSSQPSDKDYCGRASVSLWQVIKDQQVWLQGGIIICAYCGFKALDNYGLYATQVLGMNQVDAASLAATASYARPIAALAAGIIADRWHAGKSVMAFFTMTAIVFLGMAMIRPETVVFEIIIANLVLTFVSVYALRGIYFTLIEQTKITMNVTGTAVGLISLIGYTPDIFFSSITGRILDASPGFEGFQNYFLFLAIVSIAGVLFVFGLNKSTQKISIQSQ